MCPRAAFEAAANGLNFFLSQYPHMNEEQLAEIEKIVQFFAEPCTQRRMSRPALQCSVGPDGILHISHRITKDV